MRIDIDDLVTELCIHCDEAKNTKEHQDWHQAQYEQALYEQAYNL